MRSAYDALFDSQAVSILPLLLAGTCWADFKGRGQLTPQLSAHVLQHSHSMSGFSHCARDLNSSFQARRET